MKALLAIIIAVILTGIAITIYLIARIAGVL